VVDKKVEIKFWVMGGLAVSIRDFDAALTSVGKAKLIDVLECQFREMSEISAPGKQGLNGCPYFLRGLR
jgi:hypothetical protein